MSQYSFSGSRPDEYIPGFLAEQWAETYYSAEQNVFMRMGREGYSIDDLKTGEAEQHWKIKLTCEILGIESCYKRWAR